MTTSACHTSGIKRCSPNKIEPDLVRLCLNVFDFVRFVQSVRKSNSHKIRCSILFDLQT